MHWSLELMRGLWVMGGGFLLVGEVDVMSDLLLGCDGGGFGSRTGLDLNADGFTKLCKVNKQGEYYWKIVSYVGDKIYYPIFLLGNWERAA
jgi:hypothetical protein